MTPFTYLRPAGVDEAVAMLGANGPGVKIMAGGQSLLLALKERQLRPTHVLSLAGVPGLSDCTITAGGGLRIGAAATYASLAGQMLGGWHAIIGAVAGNLADRSVRNLGTIGGAVCQADPRYDMPTLLTVADASLVLVSARGERVLGAADFFAAAGGTHLAADEMLARIEFPAAARFSHVGFEKFRHRVFDAAIVTTALAWRIAPDGTIGEVRLVAGGVAKSPLRAHAAEQALAGRVPHEADAGTIAAAASDEILPAAGASTRHQKFQSELMKSLFRALIVDAGKAGEAAR